MRAWLVALLMASLALAGCTDGGDDTGAPDGEGPGAPVDDGQDPVDVPDDAPTMSVDVDAAGTYPFNPVLDPPTIEVAAGTFLTVVFTNRDQNPFVGHDIRFSGVEEQTPVLSNGESTELSFLVDLEPGEYPYWCAVGNHREQGMEGVLVVT